MKYIKIILTKFKKFIKNYLYNLILKHTGFEEKKILKLFKIYFFLQKFTKIIIISSFI